MSPGAIFGEAWEMYKAHWRTFLPLAFIVYVVLALVSLLLAILLGWFGIVLGGLVGIVGVFWLQGALVEAVQDVRDGRADLTLGETFKRVQPKVGTLIGAGLLAGLGIAVGLLLFIVPGIYLLVLWCMIVPVIVLEGAGVMDSFGRSRELGRGNGWNIAGVIGLLVLTWIAANIIVAIALFWIPDDVQGFFQSLVTNTLVVPFVALALTLMYYTLHGRAPAEAAAPPPAPTPPATTPPKPTPPATTPPEPTPPATTPPAAPPPQGSPPPPAAPPPPE
jgi:hypothetical protein